SGVTYPSAWRLRVPEHGLDLNIRPAVADQELDLSFRYWEGAVEIDGVFGDSSVNGRGYVELTGYGTTSAPRIR
ncbi:MAG: lipocalin family protein, partial [Gammaproteobacteria bacterium]|nr:lipocalin family protein [Gammaproteobacteria bacterium]